MEKFTCELSAPMDIVDSPGNPKGTVTYGINADCGYFYFCPQFGTLTNLGQDTKKLGK
jgi:hypothetical protein